MIISFLLLAFGLLILIKGADLMIGAASKIAYKLKIPAFIVGLLIVSIGTSSPELLIGIISGIRGANLLTLGDVVGSSVLNISVVLGLTAMILPITVNSRIPRRELLFSIFVQIALIIMVYTSYTLSEFESAVLLICAVLVIGYIIIKTKQVLKLKKPSTLLENELIEYIEEQEVLEKLADDNSKEKIVQIGKKKTETLSKQIILFFLGLTGLIIGAHFAVNSAVEIAHLFGLSEEFIGLTIVAFGTSLPELVTCLMAVIKNEKDIAVGNIVGSNIMNILLVLGVSGLLHSITVTGCEIFFDMIVMVGASILLLVPTYFFGKISRITGFIFFSYYIIYLSIKLSGL